MKLHTRVTCGCAQCLSTNDLVCRRVDLLYVHTVAGQCFDMMCVLFNEICNDADPFVFASGDATSLGVRRRPPAWLRLGRTRTARSTIDLVPVCLSGPFVFQAAFDLAVRYLVFSETRR